MKRKAPSQKFYFFTESQSEHYFFIDNGKLFSSGWNFCGQLGDSTTNESSLTVPEFPETKVDLIVKISLGFAHSFILTKENELFSCGSGSEGQLMHCSTRSYETMKKVIFFQKKFIENVFCGNCHSFCVVENELFASGWNNHGQLGLGGPLDIVHTPKKVNLENVKFAEGGNEISAFITRNGDLYCCGFINNDNRCAIPQKMLFNEGEKVEKVRCSRNGFLILSSKNKVYHRSSNEQVNIKKKSISYWNNIDVVDIKCGRSHYLVLTKDKKAYGWGATSKGKILTSSKYRLGQVDKESPSFLMSNVEEIHASANQSFMICSPSSCFAGGNNSQKQLGLIEDPHFVSYEKYTQVISIKQLKQHKRKIFKFQKQLFLIGIEKNNYFDIYIRF